MKIIITAIMFTILLSFSSCASDNKSGISSANPTSSEQALPAGKRTIMPTLGNTRWGMTPTETFDALKTTSSDWQKVDVGKRTDKETFVDDRYSKYTNDNLSIYGVSVKATIVFSNVLDVGLISATIIYHDDDSSNLIREKLTEIYGATNANGPTENKLKSYSWESPKVSQIFNDELWNDGEMMRKYHDELLRLEKDKNKNTLSSQEYNPQIFKEMALCSINEFSSMNTFNFEGSLAAILKWDGQISTEE